MKIAARDLKRGLTIKWSKDVHSRVLEAGASDGLVFLMHQRIDEAGQTWGPGCRFTFRADEQIEIEKSKP
jgi:hypothetical protein